MTETAFRTAPKLETTSRARPQRAQRLLSRPAQVVLNVLQRTWLILVVFGVWWFATANSTNVFIPSLESILVSLGRDLSNGVIASGAAYSLGNLAAGLLIAVTVGIIGGLILGETKRLREIVDPVIHFFRSVPQAALVPLIIGAFGIGQGPKIYTIAFACMWPVLLNTIDGVLGVEPTIRKFSKVYRIPRGLHFRRVVLPAALPQIVAGVRVALPIGITVMVVSELFAANKGLGFYILNSSATFMVPETWAGALLVGVIGYILSLLFVVLERRILSWYFKSGAK
ncbi:ABC transporter permease [Pseudarthrobacter sp. H3Y2-7]|jgi:ABC-type nitrate/sulfonate/bicarbonate transport system permease component|uniref:ABC transporter permease n=1 Tax=Pseudarthrobacter TaxID=1742993 RepID=UPI0023AED62C|nr:MULTISPECIES: ABC transporter permease [unclassified Pseudarthrobacter]MDE8669154.1 ABC transporter permease [Pseudarthrobacter sp. H3Y2-7]